MSLNPYESPEPLHEAWDVEPIQASENQQHISNTALYGVTIVLASQLGLVVAFLVGTLVWNVMLATVYREPRHIPPSVFWMQNAMAACCGLTVAGAIFQLVVLGGHRRAFYGIPASLTGLFLVGTIMTMILQRMS